MSANNGPGLISYLFLSHSLSVHSVYQYQSNSIIYIISPSLPSPLHSSSLSPQSTNNEHLHRRPRSFPLLKPHRSRGHRHRNIAGPCPTFYFLSPLLAHRFTFVSKQKKLVSTCTNALPVSTTASRCSRLGSWPMQYPHCTYSLGFFMDGFTLATFSARPFFLGRKYGERTAKYS